MVSTASSKWWPRAILEMPRSLRGGIQAAPGGAWRTGSRDFLLSLLKHNLINRHGNAGVRHLQLPAQVRHGVKAHTRGCQFQGDGVDVKRHQVKPPQLCQSRERQQAVLPPETPTATISPGSIM